MSLCSKHNIETDEQDHECPRCRGEGYIEDDDDFGPPEFVPCWNCRGSGEVLVPVCWKCDDEHGDHL